MHTSALIYKAEHPYEVAFITPLAMLLLGTKAVTFEYRKHGAPPSKGNNRRLAVKAYPVHAGAVQHARWQVSSDGVLAGGAARVPTMSMLARERKAAGLHSGVEVDVGDVEPVEVGVDVPVWLLVVVPVVLREGVPVLLREIVTVDEGDRDAVQVWLELAEPVMLPLGEPRVGEDDAVPVWLELAEPVTLPLGVPVGEDDAVPVWLELAEPVTLPLGVPVCEDEGVPL